MGRLKRKKTTSKKKTKNLSTGSASKPVEGGSVSKNQVAKSSGSSGDTMVSKIIPIKKKRPAVAKATAGKQKKNIVDKSMQFLREVKVELKKVTWPSRKQTIGSTAVVIILVMIISLFLGLVDVGLSSLIRVILQ
jgi:preprotein translocase subunit SecE